jgi:pyridoxal phosphate enzyme (YggS family)
MSIAQNLARIQQQLGPSVQLVAVSKYSSDHAVREAYQAGHRHFGENKAQDLAERHSRFPADARWHFIGHLQRNKVKYIAPFVHLIHSVDSLPLLEEIEKQGAKAGRTIACLLQVHIAREETKYGLSDNELHELITHPALPAMRHVRIEGLMGMATNTPDSETVRSEFAHLRKLFERYKATPGLSANVELRTLSMGMSGDYALAVAEGSTMVRIGSAVFSH